MFSSSLLDLIECLSSLGLVGKVCV